jgi:hypothetical protein
MHAVTGVVQYVPQIEPLMGLSLWCRGVWILYALNPESEESTKVVWWQVTQVTALVFTGSKILVWVRYLMEWISFPASVPTEELEWHSVQFRFLCSILLFVPAVPAGP